MVRRLAGEEGDLLGLGSQAIWTEAHSVGMTGCSAEKQSVAMAARTSQLCEAVSFQLPRLGVKIGTAFSLGMSRNACSHPEAENRSEDTG